MTLPARRPETLLSLQLVDVLGISVHPIMVGSGGLLFREA